MYFKVVGRYRAHIFSGECGDGILIGSDKIDQARGNKNDSVKQKKAGDQRRYKSRALMKKQGSQDTYNCDRIWP